MKVIAVVEQLLTVIPTVTSFLSYSFSAMMTERESTKPGRNVACSTESSACVLGPCTVERKSAQAILLLFIPLSSLAAFDLGLLSPQASKKVLPSPQEEPGQEVF